MLRGAGYPLDALAFIRRHDLWRLTAVAIAVNVALFIALLVASIVLVLPWVNESLDALVVWSQSFEMAVIVWLAKVIVWIGYIVAVLALLAGSSLILLLVGQAVASPFLDLLSERVENIVFKTPGDGLSIKNVATSLVFSVSDLIWNVLFLALIHIPIFFIGLIPAIGTVPASAASFLFSALLLGVEFVGMPMTRFFVPYRQRWGHLWREKWLSLGFGTSTMLLLVVPGLNLVLLPLAAVGGTLAYCDLVQDGALPKRTSRG